jgi:acetolactate synthase I/III small subunit
MAMRRGHHTSRVLKALGTPNGNGEVDIPNVPTTDIIPNEFDEH